MFYCLLVQVAIALSLLTAEVTAPPFNRLVCTFSMRPELHLLQGSTLVEKARAASSLPFARPLTLQYPVHATHHTAAPCACHLLPA
jgi:hypothetical protein